MPLTDDANDAHLDTAEPARAALHPNEPRDEVVLILGPPAAGKTRHAQGFVERGYLHLDERRGHPDELLAPLQQALQTGSRRVVLPDTYPTRRSRSGVIELATRHGLPTRAILLDTPQREALLNACHRMIQRAGRVLSPGELTAREDPDLLPPTAIAGWFKRFEEPSPDEGLAHIERVPFVRQRRPDSNNPGLILDLDGTLRTSTGKAPFPRHAGQVALMPGRRERLSQFHHRGVTLVGVTNQAGVALGQLSEANMRSAVDRTVELVGLPMDARACIHHPKAGCWCRKPHPALGVLLMREHALDPAHTWMIGDRRSDEGFAEALGLRFVHADVFFGPDGPTVDELLDPQEIS